MTNGAPTVILAFRREDDRVHSFIYLDFPEFRAYGDYAALANHEVLELLNCLGLSNDAAQQFLSLILDQTTVRRRFPISADQEALLRQQFFPGHW
jgi:hypothetical protein